MRWREFGEQVKRKTTAALGLPEEVVFDLPQIVLTGNFQVAIENHRGIVAYNRKEVRVLAGGGEVIVSGEDLVIRSIMANEVVIEGAIWGVRFG